MRRHLMRFALLSLPLALAACGGGGPGGGAGLQTSFSVRRNLTPPGPPEDPWGPYIREASARFGVPDRWIRAVIRQESGGHAVLHGEPITNASSGAMGLMQLMPATYAMLRDQNGLGDDPYDPRDNILAGTAYIAALNARYGAPGFLAAYDWGPRHLDAYLAGQARMPEETQRYLASAGPLLGGAMSGPLAVYAQNGVAPPARRYGGSMYAQRGGAGGCDADAAYDPAHPCHGPARQAPVEVAEAGETRVNAALWAPAAPAPLPAPSPGHGSRFALIPSAYADTLPMSAGGAGWGVQVGAFPDPEQARRTADGARAVTRVLAQAQPAVVRTVHADGAIWFRARLLGITHPAADAACGALTAQRWPCLAVPPGG